MHRSPEERRGTDLLEVIVCSLEDALEAERGEADRMEVVRDLDRGGLTPSLDLVRQIKNRVRVPMRVILRESEQEERPSPSVLKNLSAALSELEKIGVDGVVMGYLRDGEVDVDTMAEVLRVTPKMPVTFHHAFDGSSAPLRAIEALRALPQVDRILTSGGAGNLLERAARLNLYVKAAGTPIAVLAGGGMTRDVLHVLSTRTSVREFHVGRAARDPGSGRVRASLVRQLKETLRSAPLCVSRRCAGD